MKPFYDKKKPARDLPTPKESRSIFKSFFRLITILLVLTIISYVTIHLITRTEGFRHLLSSKLSNRLGLPMEIRDSKVDWQLNLVLYGVQTTNGAAAGQAGFSADEVICRTSIHHHWLHPSRWLAALSVKGCRLHMAQQPNGTWVPSGLSSISATIAQWGQFDMSAGTAPLANKAKRGGADAKWSQLETNAATLRGTFWETIDLQMENGTIVWYGVNGEELAAIEGIELVSIPISLPKRSMHYYYLTIRRAQSAAGWQVGDIMYEMVTAGDRSIVLGLNANWMGKAQTAKKTAAPPPTTKSVEEKPAPPPPEPVAEPTPEPGMQPAVESEVAPVDDTADQPTNLEEYIRQSLGGSQEKTEGGGRENVNEPTH